MGTQLGLAKVLDFTVNQWPAKIDKEEIKTYFDRRFELTFAVAWCRPRH